MSSRSSRHKEKHGLKSVVYQESRDEGTAARTRPFSFDDIMLRRKNKKLSGDVEDVIAEAEDIAVKEIEKVSDRSVSGRGSRNSNDILPVVKHASEDFQKVSSRKRDNISAVTGERLVNRRDRDNRDGDGLVNKRDRDSRDGNGLVNKRDRDSRDSETKKHASEGIPRVSSRNKEDNTALTGERLVNERYKGNRDSEIKSRATLNRGVSDKAKGVKDDRWDHGRRKNDDRSISHSENQPENRHAKNLVQKDRYEERIRGNSDKESKNKHRVEDDEKTRERSAMKKIDSGKWDDSETSKRKERNELSHFHREESRQKKRRSRSREHDKDRGRRSVSLSPRAQKRKSYNAAEQGELPSHSSKDKSRRQQSDDDRHRISSNGANNHYRRHGESTSQLGGYSPRKRKTEAAVKTPSPPHFSHLEKKSATWDLPPAGTDSKLTVSVISDVDTSYQTVLSNKNQISAVEPASAKTVKALSGVFSNATIDSIQLTQATRPMRRIYVENLPASVSEKDVTEYLNNCLVPGVTHLQGSDPCISCNIHKEKGQALVEFLTPEYASAALSFDGRSFSGSILKIRRPKDFVEVATGGPDKLMVAVDAISDIVRDSSHKIFIGGISKTISPEMLKEIVSAFGTLKAYRLDVNVDHNEPRAFLEYVDQSVTLKACAGLNGMRLGGQLLTVVLATPDAASSVENIGNSPFYGIPEHAKPLLEKPTQVLKLKNLLDPDSLLSLSEAELEEILEDTRLECARFGAVKSVNVVKCTDCHTNRETQVCENPSSSNGGEDLNCEDKETAIETSQHIDFESEEINRSELQNNSKEAEEDDKPVEGGGICVETHPDDIIEDKLCNPSQIDGNEDLESKDQMEYCDNKVDDTIPTTDAEVADVENESADGHKKESMEANGQLQESLAEMDLTERMDTDAPEKGENGASVFGLEDSFEPGCVLVEYKRTEAASMAAHCLHGRVFDNRIVAVGYVDYQIYKARFPK